jgi:O-antigen biosynthesis protein WbqP
MFYFWFKRFYDCVIIYRFNCFISFVIVLVIFIKLDSKGPILFKQKRIGRNKKHFYILKFRTMRIDTPKDTPTHMLENPQQWITKVGKFLRKTSLDEIPQIINILKGDMSIIGPRPALWNQYDLSRRKR